MCRSSSVLKNALTAFEFFKRLFVWSVKQDIYFFKNNCFNSLATVRPDDSLQRKIQHSTEQL